MAQPFLISMDHAEWHARAILKKHAKKRPLGRIEAEHRYKPPQPVLSCRTVVVDLAGTRTYRAKSADDIIEEQHKIIHNVYNKARNAKSAPTARNKIRYSVDSNWRTLRFLTIEGQNSPNPSTRVSYKGLAAGRPKKRPSTTGSVRANVKSLTDCHFEPSVYIDFEESSRVSKSVGSLVREQWTPKNHSLDEGQFIRGKTKESGASLDPKTGNQWLTFGGGESEESFGVVDAFVDMRNDVFYRVDGSTGVHVAKQLNKGDKIRICRNGTVVSEDTNPSPTGMVSQSSAAESFQSNARISNPLSTASRGKIPVPLCWTDEVKGSNAKILTARESRQTSARSNLNESKPVVFNDVGNDENWRDYLPKGDGLVGKDLYDIRSRSKPRIGLDGQPIRNSKITNLTIDKSKHHEAAEDVADLSVEDILEKHLHIKGEYKPKRHTQHLEAAIASPRRPEDSTHNAKKGDRELVSPTRSVAGRVHSPSLGSRQEYSVIPSRSMTPHDLNSLVVRNSNSENSSEIEAKPHTINVPKRAGIAKQPLHKTNAAKGVTFAAGYKGVDTSYIQITKKISMYKDTVKADAQSNHGSSSDDSSTVIQSVLDENKTDYFGTTTEDPDSKNKEETLEEPPVKVVDEASDELPPSPPTVQVPTRKSNQSSDSQYTINIPTAQEAESDIYFQ